MTRRARVTLEWLDDALTPTGSIITFPNVRVDDAGNLYPEPAPAEPITWTGEPE